MKESRFSEAQMVKILRESDKNPVARVGSNPPRRIPPSRIVELELR